MPFETARVEPFRIICAPWGSPKVGKTHMALTFPEPIYVVNFDMGLEGVVDKFLESKKIYTSTIQYGLMKGVSNAQALAQFEEDYAMALVEAAKAHGTVVVDTFTQVRQLVDAVTLDDVKSRRGKGKNDEDVKVFPFDYSAANLKTGSYIRQAWALPGVNLVLVHRAAKVYDAQGRETNELKMQGWNEVPSAVAMTFQMDHDDKGQFVARIDNCRANPKLRGFTVLNPDYEVLTALLKA